jgi:hypothetical protein
VLAELLVIDPQHFMIHDDKRRAVLLRQLNQFLFFHRLSVSLHRDEEDRHKARLEGRGF